VAIGKLLIKTNNRTLNQSIKTTKYNNLYRLRKKRVLGSGNNRRIKVVAIERNKEIMRVFRDMELETWN
jgi:hypothetical protein